MVERLQLVVDATTNSAEARFDALTHKARETGDASVRSAADVASAADRVLGAQAKQADAAGKLRVEQQKLTDLQERGNASAAQLAAAEERVESAQRKLHLATREATNATEAQEAAQRQATDALKDGERAQESYGKSSEGLQGRLGGLLAGGALVAGFHYLADAAQESAVVAARTENVIRTTGQAAGLTADQVGDLAGAIAMKTGADDEAIQSGANLLLTFTNVKDGVGAGNDIFSQATQLMTDMSAAMGTDASTAAVQLGKALNDPITGVSALRKVGVSFTDQQREQIRTLVESGDVMGAQKIILGELSKEFGGAAASMATPMDRVRLVVGNLAESIGSGLLPIVEAGADVMQAVVDVVGSIPVPMGLAAGAAILLGVAQASASAEGGILAGVIAGAQARFAGFTGAVAAASVGTGVLGTTMGVATVAGRGLLTVLGGPIGIAILALGAAFTFLNSKTDENDEAAQKAADANQSLAQALQASHGVITRSVRAQAALSAQQEGLLDTAAAAGVATSDLTSGLVGNEAAYKATKQAMADYADSLDAEASAMQAMGSGSAEDVKKKHQQADAVRGQIAEYDKLHGTVGEQVDKEKQLAQATDETTDKQAVATAAMDALKAAIDQGGVSTQELTKLTAEAARTQADQAVASDTAEAAIAAYRATTDQAVQSTLDLINAQLAHENAEYGYLDALDDVKSAQDDAKTSVDEVAQAHTRYKAAALDAAGAAADAAVDAAKAAGTVVGPLEEAQIRADSMLADLRDKLNQPGLTDGARADLQGLIDQLQTAKDKGDVKALVTLTGAQEAGTELDETTDDREAHIDVETRGGPAVKQYLDTLANTERLAIIRAESRGGPAVDDYLDGLAAERLAIIRVETRGGPAVKQYLDDLAGNYGRGYEATVNVRRNGSAPPASPTGAPALAGLFGAAGGDVIVQNLAVTVAADSTGRVTAQSAAEGGRQVVRQLTAYTRQNGPGWLKGLDR